MSQLMSIVQSILDLGPTVMLPIIIIVFGLILGMKFGKSLRAGVMIGIGFAGLNLVIDFLVDTLEPVIESFTVSEGGYTIADMGWATLASASWSQPFAPLVVPLIFLLNLLLLKFRATRTLNVDLWNYYHFVLAGAIMYVLTGSVVLSLLHSLLISVIALKLGDVLAPRWQKFFGLEGTTCTTIDATITYQPVAWIVNFIVDKIPGVRKIDVNPQNLQNKIGVFGEPAIIGLIAGMLISIIAGQPFDMILSVGMSVAAVMILFPRMIKLLMEGLLPISNAARDFASKRFKGWDINVGMDVALALGHPTVITSGVITVPIALLIALTLPGNEYFPLPLLAELAFYSTLPAMISNGNIFRTVLSTSAYVVYTITAFNIMAPISTKLIRGAGINTPGEAVGTTLESLDNFILTLLAKLFGFS